MYRLVLYYLTGLFILSLIFGFLGFLPYGPLGLLYSIFFLVFICFLLNQIFAKIFSVQTNVESVYITAFILFFLITPPTKFIDLTYLSFAFWSSVFAIASKYLLTIKKKHIWNPAAFGVVIPATFLGTAASWWVGTLSLAPFVAVGGILLVRKIHRSDLVFSFFFVSLVTILLTSFKSGLDPLVLLNQTFIQSSLLFLAFVMLTEPLTTPPTTNLQIFYGAMVGFLFAPAVHFGSFYFTPEMALLFGNIFVYIVSPKSRLVLTLKEKIIEADNIYDFVFESDEKMNFLPGQYLEWTLAHSPSDSRGNRRYFTIASSPTEKDIHLGVKFYEPPSSFKKKLISLEKGQTILASQLCGDFVLPKNTKKKLVFIAGGIGVTPFRSMAKYLSDKGERRDIIMLYSSKFYSDISYAQIFEEARSKIGMKTTYVLSSENSEIKQNSLPTLFGQIDQVIIFREIPDYLERTFYISGPHFMVTNFQNILTKMGVPSKQIIVDYFPGF